MKHLLILIAIALTTPAGASGLFGEPGLLFVPTADAVPRGDYAFGVNTIDEAFRGSAPSATSFSGHRATVMHYFHVGLLPRVDVSMGFVNLEGKFFAEYHNPYSNPISITAGGKRTGGWMIDRFISARYQVLAEGNGWPALAVGYRDLTGNTHWGARYLVLSRRFPGGPALPPGLGGRGGTLPPELGGRGGRLGYGLHAGYSQAPRKRAGSHGSLDGFFGGVDFWPNARLGIMAEHAGGEFHLGARVNVTRRIQLQPSLFGLKWLGGGITYTSRM